MSPHGLALMQLELSDSQREELARLLSESLSDLSSEIADTENPSYIEMLKNRRAQLSAILAQLFNGPSGVN